MLKKQAKGRYDSRRQQNGLYLAKMLIAAGHSVKIIEMKEEKAQMLAENLRKGGGYLRRRSAAGCFLRKASIPWTPLWR